MTLRSTIAVFALISTALGQSNDIKKGAAAVGDDLLAGNYGALLDLTYAGIVDLMGGREKALETIKKQMNELKEQGVSMSSYTVGDPSEIKAGGAELFAAIPMSMEMKTPQAKITAKSFLIAVSKDQGKGWFYADGTNLTPELMKAVFPKFPAELKLPEKSNAVEKLP